MKFSKQLIKLASQISSDIVQKLQQLDFEIEDFDYSLIERNIKNLPELEEEQLQNLYQNSNVFGFAVYKKSLYLNDGQQLEFQLTLKPEVEYNDGVLTMTKIIIDDIYVMSELEYDFTYMLKKGKMQSIQEDLDSIKKFFNEIEELIGQLNRLGVEIK